MSFSLIMKYKNFDDESMTTGQQSNSCYGSGLHFMSCIVYGNAKIDYKIDFWSSTTVFISHITFCNLQQ